MIKRIKQALANRRAERMARISHIVEEGKLQLTGQADAQVRMFNTQNGMILEYCWFPTPGPNQGLFAGQVSGDNISRRIVTPEEYPQIGDIILQMHVAAAARRARP